MAATVTISVEIELGWGSHDVTTADEHLSDDRVPETEALERVLGVCDRYGLAFTFDVVGHLFAIDCRGTHDGPYPAGWFEADPGTRVESDPQYYAPDLIDRVVEASVEHEICTHTFSHVLAREMPDPTVKHDIERSIDCHRERGLDRPHSLVPPRHQRPSRDVLRATEIDVVRTACRESFSDGGKIASVRRSLFRTHPIVAPRRIDGIVETPCSPAPSLTSLALPVGRRRPHAFYRHIPTAVREALHRRYLADAVDRAVDGDGYLHLWTHLYNLANDQQLQPVTAFLDALAERRADGDVRIARMADLPELVG